MSSVAELLLDQWCRAHTWSLFLRGVLTPLALMQDHLFALRQKGLGLASWDDIGRHGRARRGFFTSAAWLRLFLWWAVWCSRKTGRFLCPGTPTPHGFATPLAWGAEKITLDIGA